MKDFILSITESPAPVTTNVYSALQFPVEKVREFVEIDASLLDTDNAMLTFVVGTVQSWTLTFEVPPDSVTKSWVFFILSDGTSSIFIERLSAYSLLVSLPLSKFSKLPSVSEASTFAKLVE